jgi:HEAT repeat protein
MQALKGIGPPAKDAVPQIVKLAKTQDFREHEMVMETLQAIGPEAKEAVPELIEQADNWLSALTTLGKIGPNAKEAVPKLKEIVNGEKSGDQCWALERTKQMWAAFALARITGDAKPYVAIFQDACEDAHIEHDDGAARPVKEGAFTALAMLGPLAEPMLPDLLALLESEPDASSHMGVLEVLEAIGPAAAGATPKLIPLLKIHKELDKTGSPFFPPRSIARLIPHAAARTLGAIGPKAKDALPELKKLPEDDDDDTARIAQEAIDRIEGRK